MAIETYLIEDSEKMISEPEHLEEWLKTVEDLGLEGQKELAKPGKSPIPFLAMNRAMERVYATLCPNKTKVHQYRNSTIPLRVLSLIALSEREKYFCKVEIWDDKEKPDPVAVGYLNDNYDSPTFLIARWGDELRDFPSLKNEAITRFRENKKRDYQAKLDSLEGDIAKYFAGDWTSF